MSLLQHHSLLKKRFQAPKLVRQAQNSAPGTATSWTANVSVAPEAGNIQIFCFGGIQNRTADPPTGGGWTRVLTSVGGGTFELWWRVAPAGAASSYTLSWTGGNLQGTWAYFEVSGLSSSVIVNQYIDHTGNRTSQAYTTYNVPVAGFAVAALGLNGVATWTIDNSFVGSTTAFRFGVSSRLYSVPAINEVTTWSGATDNVSAGIHIFRAAF